MIDFFTKLFFDSKIMRIVAVGLVFYFALYQYDESQDSIAKRFNKEEVSKDLKDVKSQTMKIIDVVSRAKSITETSSGSRDGNYDLENSAKTLSEKNRYFVIKNHILMIDSLDSSFVRKVDNAKKKVNCLDVAGFSYKITDKFQNKEVYSKDSWFLTISEQENIFFERLLFDMAKGEEKEIVINQDYNFLPSIVRKYMLKAKNNVIILNLKLDDLQKGESKKIKSLSETEKLICQKRNL